MVSGQREPERLGANELRQDMFLKSDAGETLEPLVLIASNAEKLRVMRSRIRFVADSERTAEQNYRIGDRKRGHAAREQASRSREELELRYHIVLPRHIWTTPLPIESQYKQSDMFED